jgi:hypoxanthine-guanine phosphoribosyltransferase
MGLIETPVRPKIITVGSRQLHEYASPEQVQPHIERMSEQINIRDFAAYFVNINGGLWIADMFMRLQGITQQPTVIEYHRPKNGIGVERVITVPEEYSQERILVFEDVLDRGDTLMAIWKDAPFATFAVAIHKLGVPNQIRPPGVHVGLETRNEWLGGMGMDLDQIDSNIVRIHHGLVFKPNS